MSALEIFDAVPRKWPEFLREFRRKWQPGEHVALIGPTGEGKTTFAAQLLGLRKYVLACDPKGGDSTLAVLERRGFRRIDRWPPPRSVRKAIEEGEAARLIVGPRIRSKDDLPKLRTAIAGAVDGAFDDGGWTLYFDELQVAADARMMGLSASIERNLIAARDRGVSVVSSFQQPVRVPRSAYQQATHLIVYRTRDLDTVNRLAELLGRPKAEIRGALRALPKFHVAVFDRDPFGPVIVTKPHRI